VAWLGFRPSHHHPHALALPSLLQVAWYNSVIPFSPLEGGFAKTEVADFFGGPKLAYEVYDSIVRANSAEAIAKAKARKDRFLPPFPGRDRISPPPGFETPLKHGPVCSECASFAASCSHGVDVSRSLDDRWRPLISGGIALLASLVGKPLELKHINAELVKSGNALMGGLGSLAKASADIAKRGVGASLDLASGTLPSAQASASMISELAEGKDIWGIYKRTVSSSRLLPGEFRLLLEDAREVTFGDRSVADVSLMDQIHSIKRESLRAAFSRVEGFSGDAIPQDRVEELCRRVSPPPPPLFFSL
jgi:hypothetical protein